MKRVAFDATWPDSIKLSFHYDELEFWGNNSHLGYTYAYKNRFQIAIDLVTKAAKPPARVLDLAAAQGNFTLKLAELGYQVVWNDLRAELADYVRQKHEFGHIDYRAGNIFTLPNTHTGEFDVILATEIIEHVAHPDAFLEKLASLLKPHGTIVITTPNGGYCRNRLPRFSECSDPSIYEASQFKPNADGHIFLLHTDELLVLASRAGLTIGQLRLFNNPLTSGCMKSEWLLKILPPRFVGFVERLTQALPQGLQRSINMQLAASLTRNA
jgi:2-polyprenyl-3-methyl-5-hydroxy-6-metoxy-1,4-benzoquinol methylase